MKDNHPITKLEKLVLAHFWGKDWVGAYPDMDWLKVAQPKDYEEIAALTALCREYAASELLGVAHTMTDPKGDNDIYNPADWSGVIGERIRTLRQRADELEVKSELLDAKQEGTRDE